MTESRLGRICLGTRQERAHTHAISGVTGLQETLDGKQPSGSYASSTQGALADSAVQPEDLATVATTGAYSDLSGSPTIPNPGDFATAAQGSLADSAVQPEDLSTVATTGAYNDLSGKPTIPNPESFATASQGLLADSAIQPEELATVATSGSYNDLLHKPDIPEPGETAWGSITGNLENQADLNSLVSGILDDVSAVNNKLLPEGTIGNFVVVADANGAVQGSGYDAEDFATAAQGALAGTAVQPEDLAAVATTGEYSDLSGSPTIPNPGDFATAAQGVLADSAVQPGDLTTALSNRVINVAGVAGIWAGTQAAYDLLTPDASTLYVITEP